MEAHRDHTGKVEGTHHPPPTAGCPTNVPGRQAQTHIAHKHMHGLGVGSKVWLHLHLLQMPPSSSSCILLSCLQVKCPASSSSTYLVAKGKGCGWVLAGCNAGGRAVSMGNSHLGKECHSGIISLLLPPSPSCKGSRG